jgi:hypothetical protein
MFMQAGFAIVETGLCRAKNANHTQSHHDDELHGVRCRNAGLLVDRLRRSNGWRGR